MHYSDPCILSVSKTVQNKVYCKSLHNGKWLIKASMNHT